MAKVNGKRATLRVDELVRLVLPAHADFGRGAAHVARANQSGFPQKTVCGCILRSWWFWHPDAQTVATLRAEMETKDFLNFGARFQGTHLGAPIDMRPSICMRCYGIVLIGRPLRWGKEPDDEDYCTGNGDCGASVCWCPTEEEVRRERAADDERERLAEWSSP